MDVELAGERRAVHPQAEGVPDAQSIPYRPVLPETPKPLAMALC